jgi:hypothetical protein
VVLYALVPGPEARPLGEIDAIIRRHCERPVDTLASYRRAARMSRVPWPLRRPTWWAALNVFGATRGRYFGTFGMSSVGSSGAGILHLTPVLTSQLHYGLIDGGGGVEMRLSFDHRVLDGATAARALTGLEDVLLGEVLAECAAMAEPAARWAPALRA